MNRTLQYIAVMALVTYAVRMVPFVLFRRKITSPFVKSMLHYIPYAVLSAMVIPNVFYSVGANEPQNIISAAVGFAVAVVLSYLERSLLTVAVFACIAVYIMGVII